MSEPKEATDNAMLVKKWVLAVACAQLILQYMPSETDASIDAAEVEEARKYIERHAKESGWEVSKAAVGALVKSFAKVFRDPDDQPWEGGRLPDVEGMAGLRLTQPILEKAAESATDQNHDDSDEQLADSITAIINISKGSFGPPTGIIKSWTTAGFGTSTAEAVRFSVAMLALVANDEGLQQKVFDYLGKAATACATEEGAENFATYVKTGGGKSLLFLWGLYLSGVKEGLFMGWRSHEVAILEAHSSPKE